MMFYWKKIERESPDFVDGESWKHHGWRNGGMKVHVVSPSFPPFWVVFCILGSLQVGKKEASQDAASPCDLQISVSIVTRHLWQAWAKETSLVQRLAAVRNEWSHCDWMMKRARTSISQSVWVEVSNQKSNSNLMAGNVIQTHAVNGARNETISWCRCESRSMCWTETRSCIERHAKLWNPRRNTCWKYTHLILLKISNFEVQWQIEAFQFKTDGSSNENGGLPSGIATNQSLGNNKTRWAQHSLKVKAPWQGASVETAWRMQWPKKRWVQKTIWAVDTLLHSLRSDMPVASCHQIIPQLGA